MSRWEFNFNKNEQKCETITEPFGYKFLSDARSSLGKDENGNLKTEKSISNLKKLDKNENTNRSGMSEEKKRIAEKMAWNICINSLKGLGMNLFVMYMSGGASGIFGIIFILYSIYNILKSIFNINETFKTVENNTPTNYILQKVCFVIINVAVFIYIMTICSNNGLLPIRSGDYFYYIPHQEIKQTVEGSIF